MRKKLFDGHIKRIHINQHRIRSRHPEPVSVKWKRENLKCARVLIEGPAEVVYSPNKPLKCGARVWIETTSDVELLDPADVARREADESRSVSLPGESDDSRRPGVSESADRGSV